MTWDAVVVDLLGLVLIGFIVWFFCLVKAKGVRAAVTRSGYQEQLVLVEGGYTPRRDRGRAGQARAAELRPAGVGLVQRSLIVEP